MKEQYIYKVIVFVPGETSVGQLAYTIPNDAVKDVERQIKGNSDYIVFYPEEFENNPFRICVAKSLGVTIERRMIKTKSGLEVAGTGLTDIGGRPLN